MNTEHRYILEKGSKKHHCSECNKKTFVCYVDRDTNEYLPKLYGRCDRESKCSYHLNPYKDGYSKMIWKQEQGQSTDNWKPYRQIQNLKPLPKVKTTFIPNEILNKTLSNYEQNIFVQNLLQCVSFPFMVTDIEKVISLYRLGTISEGYRTGATTFPFIDIKNNVRAIQVKQFDKTNNTTGTDFIHSIIEKRNTRNNKPLPKWLKDYNKNEKKVSCLFGEHLLSKYPHNPVALVEAPKTAVYSTLYFGLPEQPTNLIWLAVFNLSSLNLNKCKSLEGRDVFLFPDLSKEGKAFELWSNKAKTIESQLQGAKFVVSNLLEQLAPEQDKEQGYDLADYLIKQDWRKFRKKQQQPKVLISEKSEAPKTNIFLSKIDVLPKVEVRSENLTKPNIENDKRLTKVNIEKDIAELETYFKSVSLPITPIRINQSSTITDVPLFVESHLSILKANNEKSMSIPYLDRLNELKEVLPNK